MCGGERAGEAMTLIRTRATCRRCLNPPLKISVPAADYLRAEVRTSLKREPISVLNDPALGEAGNVTCVRVFVDGMTVDIELRREQTGTGLTVRCIEGPDGPALAIEPDVSNTIRILPRRRR